MVDYCHVARWNGLPFVNEAGVMEIGKFIDFYNSKEDSADYSTRIECTGVHKNSVKLPSASGTLALTSQIPTTLPANGGNSDTVDGIHANGLLTALSNSDKGISITVGGTTKSVANISVNHADSATNADMLDGYHLSTLVNKSGENLIIGTTHALTIGWNKSGWSGGISTYDENNGVYKIWSTNGWNTLYYTLDSQYASKSISFSFDIMFISSESTEGPVGVYVSSSNAYIFGTNYLPSNSDLWEHKQGKITLGSTPYFGIMIRGTDNSGKSCFYLIKNLKVELGDLPTIWTPAHADITWDNLTGKPSSFTPSEHTHPYLSLSGGTLTGALIIDFNHSGGGIKSSLLNVLFNGTHDYGIVAKFHSYGGDSPAIRFSHSSNKNEYNSQVNTNWSVGMRSNTYTDFAITQDRGTSGWGTVRFAINNSGNVGIGIDSASYKLHVAGDIYSSGNILSAGGITAYSSSDIRLKTNITKLNCLKVIKSIGGTYEFDYIRDHKHSIGFIAQNVNNPLLNDIVAKDDNGYLKINYWNPKLISLAFGALTEIDDEVDKLKARVRELESEVEYLKNKDYVLQ